MNQVLILTHDNLALTKRCVESVRQQGLYPFVFDNGSTDGTGDWLVTEGMGGMILPENKGVSYGWNRGLNFCFDWGEVYHVLCVGNDTWLPPSFYRTLLSVNVPFVTGVAVDNMKQANETAEIYPLEPYPDFSAFLIRRDCWEKVGPFDERMKHYASDCDFHVRAHRMGIPLYKAAVPFFHERSSTLRNAPPAEQNEILVQADKDRAMFKSLYGCLPGTPEYENLFK